MHIAQHLRIGQPQDIAAAVAFLLSDNTSYMTGQSIAVNGGAIMIPRHGVILPTPEVR